MKIIKLLSVSYLFMQFACSAPHEIKFAVENMDITNHGIQDCIDIGSKSIKELSSDRNQRPNEDLVMNMILDTIRLLTNQSAELTNEFTRAKYDCLYFFALTGIKNAIKSHFGESNVFMETIEPKITELCKTIASSAHAKPDDQYLLYLLYMIRETDLNITKNDTVDSALLYILSTFNPGYEECYNLGIKWAAMNRELIPGYYNSESMELKTREWNQIFSTLEKAILSADSYQRVLHVVQVGHGINDYIQSIPGFKLNDTQEYLKDPKFYDRLIEKDGILINHIQNTAKESFARLNRARDTVWQKYGLNGHLK